MARMEHYENGEWVGSTEIPGHSETRGWVNTYSTDGKVRSTWVENTDTYDYKPEQHPPKSIEEIQSDRAAKETIDKVFGKLHAPMLIIGISAFVFTTIGGFIYLLLPSNVIESIVENFKLVFIIISAIVMILAFVGGFGFMIFLFMPSKSKKKSNKKK